MIWPHNLCSGNHYQVSNRSHATGSLLAVMPVGNIILEQLRDYVLQPLSTRAEEATGSQNYKLVGATREQAALTHPQHAPKP